ncbi:MAG TPA: glycosyltransferase N-terminal domain-containing protein [Albidovulum sp.]|uniref:3-deoxy-D-manno-octulosonic acid transferase n=1 Tax=Albidovulum sp. TaxID=1872424 RepID=UPI002C84C2CF|nr:glycosyltransferase N-terminal domain-containing protein [Albidovulum sp.]
MTAPTGTALRLYGWAARGLGLIAPYALRRRLARGKEDPARWREKLAEASVPRPEGALVWLHAVGLGEVLALRGLILELSARRPDLSFLITSTARSSAEVVAANLPPRTIHQFLPLDAPRFVGRFLDHWRPDLSVWAEQDLWPNFVREIHARGIPLALVNARMNDRAGRSRARVGRLYADLYARFRLIAAQDEASARALEGLGAPGPVLRHASLKVAAPALAADPVALERLAAALGGRPCWCLGSSHPEDEAVALAALAAQRQAGEGSLLIVAPRRIERGAEIVGAAQAVSLVAALRSTGAGPDGADVYVADTFGEMGLWYRLCDRVLMGGTFGPVEGHNPWEPARLGAAVLHGPRTANFAADYVALDAAGAALEVQDAAAVAAALGADLSALGARGQALAEEGSADIAGLADRLVALMPAVRNG